MDIDREPGSVSMLSLIIRGRAGWRPAVHGLLLCGVCLALPVQAFPRMPLEGMSDSRWLKFERRLKELQAGIASDSLNILQLGDSHTAGEFLSGRMRERFQRKYGNGSVGILPPGALKGHPAYQARVLPSAQWVTVRERNAKSPASGLGGMVGYGSGPYQTVMYEFPKAAGMARLFVYSAGSAEPGFGFRLYHDGVQMQPTPAGEGESGGGRAVFDLPASGGRLTVLARGASDAFQLFGLTGLAQSPGVTFSSIGVNGASLDILREWDTDTTRAQMRDFAPGLLILAFGTNDVVNTDFSHERFREVLRRTGDWLRRNAPESAVLVVMPPRAPGHGERARQNLETARFLIRQAAADQRWRVWDWSALTDRKCVSACNSVDAVPFFRADGIHLTRQGYEATADALFEAIVGASPW